MKLNHCFATAIGTFVITGIGTVYECMLILVDIEKRMSGAEMALLEKSTVHKALSSSKTDQA